MRAGGEADSTTVDVLRHVAAPTASTRSSAQPELPEEFAGPVAYSDVWQWLAIGLLVAVVLYYVLTWWFTRPPKPPKVERPATVDVPGVREEHLGRIDTVVARVRAGATPARDGHQVLSEIVRSYVGTVTTLPAPTMTLADFRASAPTELVDAIALMYPPEFAPDDAHAQDTFDDAVAHARRLVGTWS